MLPSVIIFLPFAFFVYLVHLLDQMVIQKQIDTENWIKGQKNKCHQLFGETLYYLYFAPLVIMFICASVFFISLVAVSLVCSTVLSVYKLLINLVELFYGLCINIVAYLHNAFLNILSSMLLKLFPKACLKGIVNIIKQIGFNDNESLSLDPGDVVIGDAASTENFYPTGLSEGLSCFGSDRSLSSQSDESYESGKLCPYLSKQL